MGTLTETISQDLLAARDDPAKIDAVLKRHASSKGPLYHALAQATTALRDGLTARIDELARVDGRCRAAEERERSLTERCRDLANRAEALALKTQEAEERLAGLKSVLERADALAAQGFGGAELDRLAALLAQIAAGQGASPEEGVAQFFGTVGRYERTVSLDLEATRAESRAAQARAEAERFEAEARAAEARSRARRTSIALCEKLLAQGVKEKDLPRWARIMANAGVAPEDLAAGLERYASLAKLAEGRRREAAELERQARTVRAQVEALVKERDGIHEAVIALKRAGLREVGQARDGVLAALAALDNKVKAIGAALAEGAGRAYHLGWSDAETQYRVDFLCCACGKPLPVTSPQAKQAAASFLQVQGWGHQECVAPPVPAPKALPAPWTRR